MSKPLELTWYECADCGDTRCYIIETDKHLTDAELAAEWQQAKRHEAVAVIIRKPEATREIRRVQTLERFATLPHASDTDYR